MTAHIPMMKHLALSTFAALTVLSCKPAKTPDSPPPPAEMPAPTPDPAEPESLIGLTLEAAEAAADTANLPHRVIQIDGQPRPATKDYRPERLNFTVEKGIVTAVTNG